MQSHWRKPFTVVALHGNGGGAFRFARILPHLPPDVHFQAVTLPGFAAQPADAALRTMRDYACYLRDAVVAEPRPRVLLGHGIGGSIALEFAQHFPGEIDGMILHAPVGARLETRFFPRLMALPGARALGQRLIASPLMRPFFTRLFFTQPIPSDDLERFFDGYRQCAVFAQMFALITPAWFHALSPVKVPSILLWGRRERVLSVKHARDYDHVLPDNELHIVSHWDHFPMLEQPEDYARTVVDLARRLIR